MNVTYKSILTALNIIYFSIAATMAAFSLVVFYLNTSGSIAADPQMASTFRYVLFALMPIGMATGYFVFKQLMRSVSPTLTLREKLARYQIALLVRSACFEIPGLFGAVATMTTGDNTFLLATAIIIVFFMLLRPSVYSITVDLGLSKKEIETLHNPSSQL
jgi:hypothetical protein